MHEQLHFKKKWFSSENEITKSFGYSWLVFALVYTLENIIFFVSMFLRKYFHQYQLLGVNSFLIETISDSPADYEIKLFQSILLPINELDL